jgi:imidazolonepropionase-like amidohydrolase
VYIIAQREMINHGKIQGPRLFVSGDPITGPQDLSRMSSAPEQSGAVTHVTTVEEARAAVRKNAAAGVDMIHVEEALTPELLKAVVDEAAKHHLPVWGHSRDIREAAQAGLRYMEHSVPLAHSILQVDDPKHFQEFDWKDVEFPGAEYRMNPASYAEIIKFMVSKGVFVNLTYSLQWGSANPRFPEWTGVAADLAKEPGIEFVPEDVRRGWNLSARKPSLPAEQLSEGFKRVQEFTRQYAQAGGKLLAGTDSYGGVGLQGAVLSFEMESLVDAGATPMQAIMAATKNAAELGYKEKDLGTVEPGKLADLVVIDGNPLKDIATIRNVSLVVKDGQVIDRTYDAKFVNPIGRTALNGQLKGPENGPEVSTLAPLIAAQGDRDVVIQLTGKRFDSHSVVRFNAVDLKTHFISDSQLTAVIPGADLRDVGTYQVMVASSDSGVKSNLRYFIVNFRY